MDKALLIESACRELLQYGVRDGRAKWKYRIRRYLLRQETAKEDPIFWPTGLLAAGLWRCLRELREDGMALEKDETPEKKYLAEAVKGALSAYYTRWLQKGMPVNVIDDLLAGETLFSIYEEMEAESVTELCGLSKNVAKAALDKLAAYAAGHPVDGAGSLPYRPVHSGTAVFVDAIGLACPFLYQYGETFDEPVYRELAVRQIVNFLSYGMDGKTGLPYHGYDTADGCKYGVIGWGRAVGWLLRGMCGCLSSAYGRERLSAPYQELTDAALAWQRQDGYFSWQLEALEGPADTSATAIICAALQQGMAQGVLTGEKYDMALSAGKRALEKSAREDGVYDCSGECGGFACYPQRYGAYPWSLGPALIVL